MKAKFCNDYNHYKTIAMNSSGAKPSQELLHPGQTRRTRKVIWEKDKLLTSQLEVFI